MAEALIGVGWRGLLLAAPFTLGLASAALAQSAAGPADSISVLIFEPAARLLTEFDLPIHPGVAPSPDGRFFAALQARPDPVLWIVPADGGKPFAYRENWAAFRPRWAPSGARIGFIAGIGPPRIWTVEVDPASGRPVDPPRLLIRTAANAFAFSPDGERVALVASRSTSVGASEIHIVEWESRRAWTLLREDGLVYWLDWSPDGRFIYYGTIPNSPAGDSPHLVRRAVIGSGAPETLRRAGEFLGLSPDGLYLMYRPSHEPGGANMVEISHVDGGRVFWYALAPGPSSLRWGADSRTIIQVRASERGEAIYEIALCPVCPFLFW